jgi:hypothetical protein
MACGVGAPQAHRVPELQKADDLFVSSLFGF